MRRDVEWASPAIEMGIEMRALSRRAREKTLDALGAGQGTDSILQASALLLRARRSALDLTEAAAEAGDLAWASEAPFGSYAGSEAPPPMGRREVLRRIADELERLLVTGQERYRVDPLDLGPDGWRREFLDIQVLARWFPDADGDQRFRKLAGEYLGR